MGTDAEETAAIEALDGADWMGRALKWTRLSLKKTEVLLVVVGIAIAEIQGATKLWECKLISQNVLRADLELLFCTLAHVKHPLPYA
jgi:hypothetical protein